MPSAQYEMKAMLAAARQSCKQLVKSHAQANELMSKHFSELTVPLHERVEEYVKGLQEELDEAQRCRLAAHYLPAFRARHWQGSCDYAVFFGFFVCVSVCVCVLVCECMAQLADCSSVR